MIKIGDIYFPDIERHFQGFGDDVADYQRPQREYAMKFVKVWDTALDLGANVGIFSRHFAAHFRQVIAVDPLQDNIECLQKNVPGNVKIVKTAVGDRSGSFKIYKPRKSLGGAFVADHENVEVPPGLEAKINDATIEAVEMCTVDSMDLENVGLIKLDIQGSELIALKGATQTLSRCNPVILIEEKPLGGPGGSMAHVHESRDFLLACGYKMEKLVGADRVYVRE
ncbi:MAG: FkbM family methyltransferase [Methylobacterium frigidaeris]